MLRHAVKPCGGCAIVLRLQVRGAPAGASLSSPRLGTGPSLSSLSLSCFARKTRACRPWHARLPGKGSTGPFAMLRFTHGLGVRRDERPPDTRLYPVHPLDTRVLPPHAPDARLIPAHPLAPWQVCGAPRAGPFGRENCHGHLSFRGLTPAGSVPASRGWQRSQIKLLSRVWARVRAHGTVPGRTFQQVRSLGACTLDEACGGDGFSAWLAPDWYNESMYRRYEPER